MPTSRVTSGDFQKAFGLYRETALREPLTITHHGRDSLVIMAAEEYERLKGLDRQAFHVWELSDTDLKAVAAAEPPADAEAFDHEYPDR